MNKTESKGTWNEHKSKLKQKFAALSQNDLLFEKGKKDEWIVEFQIPPGKLKDELGIIFNPFNLNSKNTLLLKLNLLATSI